MYKAPISRDLIIIDVLYWLRNNHEEKVTSTGQKSGFFPV